jgi:hypothetical protein
MRISTIKQPTGLCHICGKPTKLLIHQKCGIGRAKGEGSSKFVGKHGTLTAAHKAKAEDNQHRKQYSNLTRMGWIPKD